MARAYAALLLIVAMVLVANASADPTCPPNQEWTTCGSACPRACNQDPLSACTLQCVIGCQCKQGYSLDNNGDCILTEDC